MVHGPSLKFELAIIIIMINFLRNSLEDCHMKGSYLKMSNWKHKNYLVFKKKMVQDQLVNDTGKVILLRDLSKKRSLLRLGMICKNVSSN